MLIGNIYRPPNGEKLEFINTLARLTALIPQIENFDDILTGDMNINVLTEDDNKEELYNCLGDFSLRQLITSPTRIRERQSCLDIIFTNIVQVNDSGVANINISDHLPVFIRLKKDKIIFNQRSFVGRSYKNHNSKNFKAEFLAADWSSFDDSNDPSVCWDHYYNIISSLLDKSCPFVNKNKDEDCLTPELKTRIAKKNLALKRARRINRLTMYMWLVRLRKM